VRLTILVMGTMIVVTETWTHSEGRVAGMRAHDGPRSNSRGRLHLHISCGVDDRGRVDCRHPNAHFVLLEEVRNQFVEVDIRFRIVVVRQLMIVTRHCQYGSTMRKVRTYAWYSASKISMLSLWSAAF
jgi:hypothetical protein